MANILVVDDEEDIRTFLTIYMEDNGHNVKSAKDSEKGLEILKSYCPDLIILDVIMPHQSGIVLYNKIKNIEKFKSVPVIILSAIVKQKDQFKDKFGNLPEPDAFVDKPFDEKKMAGLVNSLLQKVNLP